jgi:hypothetical protein
VKNNAEADMLAEYARKHFSGCGEILEPHMCMHGRIIFARKIRFDECTEKDIAGMIETMKQSGHIPNELIKKAERIQKTSNSGAVIKSELSELMSRENEVWKSAFKFYSSD